jgi:hypothetical protein
VNSLRWVAGYFGILSGRLVLDGVSELNLFGSRRPWYVDGLAFECTGCGRCCSGPEEGYVWVMSQEITAAAGQLGVTVEQFMARYTRRIGRRTSLIEKANRDCVFLEESNGGPRRCLSYAVRPAQCQTWPFWPSNLLGENAWARVGERCPGINRGPLHLADHIEHERERTG